MISKPVARLVVLLAFVAGASHFDSAWAVHAAVGTPVSNAEMPLLGGGKAFPLRDVEASVLVFFRPNQPRSLAALRELAQCQTGFAGKSVHWTSVISGSAPADSVPATLRDTGFAAPVLVDREDTLYGSLGLALHPVVVIVGRDQKLAAFEPYRAVDFCAVVGARIRHLLREISDADLDSALNPPKSSQGGDAQVARRYRAFAEVLFKSKNYEAALQNVRKSLDKDPQLAPAHALLGKILAAQGNCAEAIAAFRQALVIDTSNAEAKEGLENCKPAR